MEDRRLTTFTPGEMNLLKDSVKSPVKLEELKIFQELNDVIDDSISKLPTSAKTSLVKVSEAYSDIDAKVNRGLAQAGAVLSKFVIKTAKVFNRGMSADDLAALKTLSSQLNIHFVKELENFSESSRTELCSVFSSMMKTTAGSEIVKDLLDRQQELSKQLAKNSEELENLAIEIGAIMGRIASYNYQIEMSEKAMQNSEALKKDVTKELEDLQAQKSRYKQELENLRDSRFKSTERKWSIFFIFSYESRDNYNDQGERIAREMLASVEQRIDTISQTLNKWSTTDFETKKQEALAEKPKEEQLLPVKKKEYEKVEQQQAEREEELHAIEKQIRGIYTECGCDKAGIIQMEKLAKAIRDGSSALQKSFAAIGGYMSGISSEDPDQLVLSVVEALKILSIGDQYTGTNRIATLQTVLSVA